MFSQFNHFFLDLTVPLQPRQCDWAAQFFKFYLKRRSRTLLKKLKEKDVRATFFVVGSRVIERPGMLIEEYMSGHEISVHTWSHSV